MSLYLPLFKALNDAEVKYVVVGGVATVLHGYARLTMDIEGVPVYICSLDDLIALKQLSGRPLDLLDIEKLRVIRERRQRGKN